MYSAPCSCPMLTKFRYFNASLHVILYGNLPIESRPDNAERRKNIKQMGVSATIPERTKITCDSREERITRQHFSCAKSMVLENKFFRYLPVAVLKDICTCQLQVILSHRRHGLYFVQTVQRPPTEISEQQLNVLLRPYVFLHLHLCSYCER